MRKLYYKSTQERRRRFQIYTSIVEDDGKKYAIKEAVFSEGKKHIENIRHNYDLVWFYSNNISKHIPCRLKELSSFEY